MKELLEYIAKKILPHAEDVVVEEQVEENGTIHLNLITHPEDTGLAIGKGGKTAHSLRELLKIKAIQDKTKVFLNIMSRDEYEQQKIEGDKPTQTESQEVVDSSEMEVQQETPLLEEVKELEQPAALEEPQA